MLNAHPVPAVYRQPLLGPLDREFRRALGISAALGALVLVLVFVAPPPPVEESTVEELPERLAKLILEEAKPAPTPPPAVAEATPRAELPEPEVAEPEPKAVETPKPTPTPRRTTREEKPKLAQDRGTQGRAKAQAEVTQQLAQVTTSVEKTLENLSASLPTATTSDDAPAAAPRRRGGRKVRGARGASQIASAGARETSGGGTVGGTALDAGPVEIGSISGLTVTDASGKPITPSGGGGATSSGGRSQSSLLAVVKRYSPGIRYCYDTALKADPALQGKLVFRLTISASGQVTDVAIVEDTLRSRAVVDCAKTQILSWKFPSASEAVSFQTPFVFRPPK